MRASGALRRGRSGRYGARCTAYGALLIVLSACADTEARPEARAAAAAESAVSAVDDVGRTVRLPRPARRIVSLLPAGTETLLALGAGDRIVGRTRYDEDPAVAHLPSVGGGLDPSLESLVALRPDLVLAWEPPGGSDVRARLEAVGIPVFALSTRDTAAIFRNVESLGRLTGRGAAADSLAAHLREVLAAVSASAPPGPRPSVLYVISVDPPIVAGTDNFIAEVVEIGGGEPVALSAREKGQSPQVSLEALVRLQPDVVILPIGENASASLERLRREPGWRDLAAVREGRVATVEADPMHRPGPSVARAATMMRDAIRSVWGGR